MLIIGERINSTRKTIHEIIKNRNAGLIVKEAVSQLKAGASFIDINCAVTSGDEVQDVDWVVSVIQSEIRDVNICIDSPNYLAIERALGTYKAGGRVMINSITGEEARLEKMLPLAVKYKAKLIALAMDDKGMPYTAAARAAIAKNILDRLKKEKFNPDDIYIDPLVRPIATEPHQAREFLKAIPMIKELGVKTICGLSNVSFGLPDRKVINASFLSMAVQAGLDAAILDPMDKLIVSHLKASRALSGIDEYCAEYIQAFREGKLI